MLGLTISVINNIGASKKDVEHTRNIVNEHLSDKGFTGIWTVKLLCKQPLNSSQFSAKSIINPGGIKVIKLWTSYKDRDGSFESHLSPPNNYDINDVFATLKPQKRVLSDNDLNIQNQTDENLVSISKSINKICVGDVFPGTVVDVQSSFCLIDILPSVVGLCHINEWDYGKPINCKVGDEVKVMVLDIEQHGKSKKIFLSRTKAIDMSIKSNDEIGYNSKGKFTLNGYADSEQNLFEFLQVFSESYSKTVGESYYCSSVPTFIFLPLWEQFIKNKFKLSYIGPLFSFITPLVLRGWLEKVDIKGKHKHYRITAKGWDEIIGPNSKPNEVFELLGLDKDLVYSKLSTTPVIQNPKLIKTEFLECKPDQKPKEPKKVKTDQPKRLDDLISKLNRMKEVETQISILQEEFTELSLWLEDNGVKI